MSDDHEIPAEELAVRAKLRDDLALYAKKCLFIRAKSGEIYPLALNTAQTHVHKLLEEQRKEKGRVRAIILKARQMGISTYVAARYYWQVTHRKGVRVMVMAHEDAATQNLYDLVQRYHQYCPEVMRPTTGTASAKEMSFASLGSGYKLATAGSKAVGRSSTVQLMHASELAFWPFAADHMAGMMQAIPHEAGTEVIIESTANGIGGEFHKKWLDAVHKESDYQAIFLPWFWMPEYRRPATGLEFDAEERELAALHGLDNEQLAFRRAKIFELGEDLWKQEYPSTWEEAFLFSGRPVFSVTALTKAKAGVINPIQTCEVINGALRENDKGRLKIFEQPKPGTQYVVGADVAEGLAHGDYSCADVLSAIDGRQVAQWHGHTPPDVFGEILVALGRHYNAAYVGVERNNHGLTTLTRMVDLEYPNLYVQKELDQKTSGKLGWTTTSKSKFRLIDQLAAELREGTHGICCAETLSEMLTYVILDNGGFEATPGCFDDRVMSRAIAGEVRATFAVDSTIGASLGRAVEIKSAAGWD